MHGSCCSPSSWMLLRGCRAGRSGCWAGRSRRLSSAATTDTFLEAMELLKAVTESADPETIEVTLHGCSAVVSSSSLTRTRASPVIIVSVSFRPSAQLGCLLLPGELILRPFLNPMRASHPLVLHVPHPHTLEPCTACHRPAPPDSRGAPRAWPRPRSVGTQYPVLQHRGQGASRGRRASEAVRSVMSG